MTTERVNGKVVVHCDKCSAEVFESEHEDFREAMADARAAGWVSALVDDEWHHFGPDCKHETEGKR